MGCIPEIAIVAGELLLRAGVTMLHFVENFHRINSPGTGDLCQRHLCDGIHVLHALAEVLSFLSDVVGLLFGVVPHSLICTANVGSWGMFLTSQSRRE